MKVAEQIRQQARAVRSHGTLGDDQVVEVQERAHLGHAGTAESLGAQSLRDAARGERPRYRVGGSPASRRVLGEVVYHARSVY